jgi:hypothetical protein
MGVCPMSKGNNPLMRKTNVGCKIPEKIKKNGFMYLPQKMKKGLHREY